MDKKKIGLVLSFVPGYSETFFTNKIKLLKMEGHEIVLFIDYKQKEDTLLNCKTVVSPNLTTNQFTNAIIGLKALLVSTFLTPLRSLKLLRLNGNSGTGLKENLENLILNHKFLKYNLDYLHFGFGMLAVGRENVAEAIGAKMAVSFRGFDLYLSPLKHPDCYSLLFETEVKYHVLSEEMSRDLQNYGIAPNKIHIITPAINVSFFKGHKNKSESNDLKIITIARLHWKKGLEYTLEAMSILKRRGINFTYTIIGEGDQYERLIYAAYQLGILDKVRFEGRLSSQQVKKQLENSDIYVQYSIQEGFCNAVLEAQAMGLLCIVSNAEGLAENVLSGKTGWVIPKRDPLKLADTIIEVKNLEPSLKSEISKNAIKRIQNEFNLKIQQKKFNEFYGD